MVHTIPMPTTLTAPKQLTAAEFARLPDEARGFELIDGRVQRQTVSNKSSRLSVRIATFFENFMLVNSIGYVFGSDQNYQCFDGQPNLVRKADVSVILRSRMSPEEYDRDGFCQIVPDLVVEVASPRDVISKFERKLKLWLATGVKLVWAVDPETETVRVLEPGKPIVFFNRGETLTGEPVLTGFTLRVDDIFMR
jgi:Uma2 family endonuclease